MATSGARGNATTKSTAMVNTANTSCISGEGSNAARSASASAMCRLVPARMPSPSAQALLVLPGPRSRTVVGVSPAASRGWCPEDSMSSRATAEPAPDVDAAAGVPPDAPASAGLEPAGALTRWRGALPHPQQHHQQHRGKHLRRLQQSTCVQCSISQGSKTSVTLPRINLVRSSDATCAWSCTMQSGEPSGPGEHGSMRPLKMRDARVCAKAVHRSANDTFTALKTPCLQMRLASCSTSVGRFSQFVRQTAMRL
mmetsp:Transcript_20694/g.79409  ORF Transcript_20694/g.79409 Transcript_20694/m.79409 type:complete len:255 (+) Transcript_20694:674-1438(+)